MVTSRPRATYTICDLEGDLALVNHEIIVLKIFRVANIRVKNFVRGDPLPYTLMLCVKFSRLIFVARTDYENILTTKISRFTV